MKKNINYTLFNSLILLICGYEMDKNINYKTTLDNNKVCKHLKSYKVDDEIITYVKKKLNFCGDIYYFRNDADSECMIYHTNEECYLVFIGTQFSLNDKMSLCKDLWTDICLGLKSIDFLDSKIKMHSKYIDNMNNGDLLKNIICTVEKLNFKKIYICGHSMGCGLGLYTSLVLTKKFPDIKFNLITIDSPKIGNLKLNKYVKKINNFDHFDLVNNKDIIPLFPFIYHDYLHIAHKTHMINNDGIINVCKNLNSKITIFTNNSIKDHFTNNIIRNIYKSLIEQSTSRS